MSATAKCKSDTAIKRALSNTEIKKIQIEGQKLFLLPKKNRLSATWYFYYHESGIRVQKKLGTFPEFILSDIQQIKLNILSKLHSGERVSANDNSIIYMSELFNWYRSKLTDKRDDRKKSILCALKNHLIPFFGNIKISQIRKDDVHDFIQEQQIQCCAASSVRLRYSILKQVLTRAANIDLIEFNFLAGIKVSAFTQATVNPRESRLKKRHIKKMINGIEQCKNNKPALVFNLLCILNGTRLNETRLIKWSEVDFDNKEFTLLANTVKNQQEHVLPMTEQVYNLLFSYKEWQEKRYKGLYLFPSDSRGVMSRSTAKSYVTLISNAAKIKFSCHDYRKLIKSMLSELAIENFIGERVINHKMKTIELAYTQSELSKRLLAALSVWHDYLDRFYQDKHEIYMNSLKKKSANEPLYSAA